jgi:DNA-binding NarL/FixJ family response regulator
MSIRVLLVDDHTMFRQALRAMLDKEPTIEVVGEVGDGSEVAAAAEQHAADVVVMDINLPKVNGIEATRQLLAGQPDMKVVALSAHGYQQFILEMLDAGATGYVVKSAAAEQLVQAIASVMQGQTYLCPESTATLVQARQRARQRSGANLSATQQRLGRREIEVLQLLARGLSSPEIGRTLHIATSTVDVHRRNIMDKLELRSVAELTKYAIRAGLTEV